MRHSDKHLHALSYLVISITLESLFNSFFPKVGFAQTLKVLLVKIKTKLGHTAFSKHLCRVTAQTSLLQAVRTSIVSEKNNLDNLVFCRSFGHLMLINSSCMEHILGDIDLEL